MDSRRPTPIELVDERPSAPLGGQANLPSAVRAKTVTGLRTIERRARGWTCDVRGVALDDQSGKLHVPLVEKVDRRSPSTRVAAGELIVHRVEEFALEGAARARWFEFDTIGYEPATRRLSIASAGRSQFALTVEGLEVTLRIRPQTRPRA
ncbi:MAG TPA: hypothetical protein VHL53_05660 [Acidimicrobiia bacterium]|nr:hypothetical protein [Acidimicrobiia bacterium]